MDQATAAARRHEQALPHSAAYSNSGASGDALVEAAKALRPVLQMRAETTERLRRLPDETIADFHRHGLFRVIQPHRVGGHEMHPAVYMDVCAEIARACASSAWVLSNLAIHHHFLALWPEEAQRDVWSASPDTLIGSSYIFSAGSAVAVPGGWKISGRWPFSSGIDPCAWVMVGAMVSGPQGSPEQRYFMLPRSDYEIIDSWHVVGLRGTGSKDVQIKEAFVPAHRSLSFAETTGGKAPGLELNPGPLFRLPMQVIGGLTLLAVIYGSARGAVEDYITGVKSRASRGKGAPLKDLSAIQTRVAEAEANLDAVELIMRAAWEGVMRSAERQGAVDPRYGIRIRRDSAWCTRLCVDAVDIVFAGSGGGGLYEAGSIQRHWRDVHAGAAQFGLQWDVWGPAYGRVQLGLESGMPGLNV